MRKEIARNCLGWFGGFFFWGHRGAFSIYRVVSAISVSLSLLCRCWCWWCCKSACKARLAKAACKAEICPLYFEQTRGRNYTSWLPSSVSLSGVCFTAPVSLQKFWGWGSIYIPQIYIHLYMCIDTSMYEITDIGIYIYASVCTFIYETEVSDEGLCIYNYPDSFGETYWTYLCYRENDWMCILHLFSSLISILFYFCILFLLFLSVFPPFCLNVLEDK